MGSVVQPSVVRGCSGCVSVRVSVCDGVTMSPLQLLSLSILPTVLLGLDLVSYLPGPGTITREGSPLSLSCSSSSPWFFCLWHSPVGGKQCAIQENQVQASVCGHQSQGRRLHSNSHKECSLRIERLAREDHGNWMCLLNDIKEFDTVKASVYVEVGVEASIQWGSIQGLEEDGRLVMVEGDTRDIQCVARGGYPTPTFTWTAHTPHTRERDRRQGDTGGLQERSVETSYSLGSHTHTHIQLNRTGEVSLVQSGGHLYHGKQSLSYTARLQDHGTNVTCTVTQLDRVGGILYMSSITLQLEVSELVVYSQGSEVLEERIAIISGVMLAIIFIILIFVLIALLLSRKRKKEPKYQAVSGDMCKDTGVLATVWKHGRRSKVCLVSLEREYSEHYLECEDSLIEAGVHFEDREAADTGSLLSGDSMEQSTGLGGHSLSRPTTRTTKTISSASDSSRSSMVTTDKSLKDGGGEDTYINFQPEILTCELTRQARELSSSSSSCPFSPCTSDRLPRTPIQSRLHETHFGDNIQSIPCTVVHSGQYRTLGEGGNTRRDHTVSPVSVLSPSYLHTLLPLGLPKPFHLKSGVQLRRGNTIFDCELGCFVTLEEYQRRRSKEKLNIEEER